MRKCKQTYLATMLPGTAMVKVCDLPPFGVKTAVGLEVKISSWLLLPWAGPFSWNVLRFCGTVSETARKGSRGYMGIP